MEGYIASFEITPASTDDREGLRDLAVHWSNVTILADKGYVGKNMGQEMQKECWPEAFRGYVPVWLIKYWHTISVLH